MMQKRNNHRIRRQRWQIHAGSAEDAFYWRRFIHDQLQELLLPLLEKEFDEAVPAGCVIHIPMIELKVKANQAQQSPELLPDLIFQQLREQLQPLLQKQVQSTAQKDRFENLLHYLHTGSVPWQAVSVSADETTMTLADTCREEWPQLLDYLRNRQVGTSFYFRLMQLISGEECSSLVYSLSDGIPQIFKTAVVQCITLLIGSWGNVFNRHTQLQLAAGFLSESLRWREESVAPGLFSIAAEGVPPGDRNILHKFISSLPEPAAALFQQKRLEVSRGADEASVANERDKNVPPIVYTYGDTYVDRRGFLTPPEGAMFPLMVHDAGLILLHPFIAGLFENSGITEAGNTQISSFALPRAAALLYFLATGREEIYEYEIGFIKILLGLHPETPLPVCEGLVKPGDKDEAEALLQSVIRHWSVLKNTSLHGLRSSFLKRQGLLLEEENEWKLKVERNPFDVLLDQLPWGISIIKLPWMKKPIYTEWR